MPSSDSPSPDPSDEGTSRLDETGVPLANVMQQPLDVAVEAARQRWGSSRAVEHIEVSEDDSGIDVVLDPQSTDALLMPQQFLGWPMRYWTGEGR